MNMLFDGQNIHVSLLDFQDSHECGCFDDYVRSHDDSTPYHLTLWGKAVARALGHRPCYLVARRHGVILGILPLMHVRSRLFGSAMVSSSLAMRGGPLVHMQAARVALDRAACQIAQTNHCNILEYRAPAPSTDGWKNIESVYANFSRPLANNTSDNLKAIPRKQRAEVRRSLDFGLETRIGCDAQDLAQHFHVYATSVRNLGTPVFSRTLFKAILAFYKSESDILTVLHEGQPLASVLSLYHKNRVYPHFGGGLQAARQWRANDHMYWQLMEHARCRGIEIFDFGRSKIGTGAYDFKKNWGFHPEPMRYSLYLAQGQKAPDLNPNSPRYHLMTSLWKKCPLWLANMAGPFVSRHFY